MHAMQQEEVAVEEQEVTSPSYWTRFKNFLHKTPLFPGWRSTEEQKVVAAEKMANLLLEREQLEDERKLDQISDERLQEINKELKRIADEIKAQKVVLGQDWSNARKLAAAGGLGIVAGLGMGLGIVAGLDIKYARSEPLLPGNFDKLVKNKKFRWQIWDRSNKKYSYVDGDNTRDLITEVKSVQGDKNKYYILQYLNETTGEWINPGYEMYYKDYVNKWIIRDEYTLGKKTFFDIKTFKMLH